ncbi:MAG: hypothetical protein ACKO7B_01080 [Flavobacteriales bacterium]
MSLLFCLNATAQNEAVSDENLNKQCEEAGFQIQGYSKDFDTYRYQKAFLNFDRMDQFRKPTQTNTFVLENGEAKVILFSAESIKGKRALKSEPLGEHMPPLKFVLNVNGQVKEQPLN